MERDNLLKGLATRKRSRMPLNRLYFFIALILFVLVLLIGFRFSGAYNDLQNRAEWALSLSNATLQEKGSNYLLYGFYEESGELYLEDMFFLNYPPDTESPHIIYIPGEILLNRQVGLENWNLSQEQENGTNERLATFFYPAHFYREGGAKLLIEQLSYYLGVPVHYYLEIDYRGVPEMVDYGGGFEHGDYVLNGDDYYEYFLKGEKDEKPLKRSLHRMQALDKLVEFVGEKKGIFSKSRSVRKAAPYIDTNMTWNELEEFYPSLLTLFNGRDDDVIILPGTWREQIDGEYYYEPNKELITYMMANLGEDFILPRELIKVAVLNGSGVPGVAAQVAGMLEAEGFEVVEVGNADAYDYPRSQVISRQDEMEPAREVALIIPGSELLKETVEGSPAMVTVIIGQNFTLE